MAAIALENSGHNIFSVFMIRENTGGIIMVQILSKRPKKLNSFIKCVDKVMRVLLVTIVGALTCGVIISVFLRYIFHISFAWSEEIISIFFVASTFLGAAFGVREKENIAINLNFDKLSPSISKAIRIIASIVIIIVSLFFFIYSIIWISHVGSIPSVCTGIRCGIYYSIVPISFVITIFYSIINIIAEFVHIDQPEEFMANRNAKKKTVSEEKCI